MKTLPPKNVKVTSPGGGVHGPGLEHSETWSGRPNFLDWLDDASGAGASITTGRMHPDERPQTARISDLRGECRRQGRESEDFVCISSEAPCAVDGVFTQSRFAGPCVQIDGERVVSGRAQAIVRGLQERKRGDVTGERGERDARAAGRRGRRSLALAESDVLIAGTGVIGRLWPLDKLLPHAGRGEQDAGGGLPRRGAGHRHADTTPPKLSSARIGDATLVGIAKGIGVVATTEHGNALRLPLHRREGRARGALGGLPRRDRSAPSTG